MACFLLLVIAATVLTAPPGTKQLTHAARTTSPEAFWRAALPDAPMPESIRNLLHPRAEANAPDVDDDNVRDDDPPPPMNFNYDDYRSSPSPRHQASPSTKPLEHCARASSSPMVFFPEDAVRVGGSLPFPRPPAPPNDDDEAATAHPPVELYTVRAVRAVEGSSFVLCRRGEVAGSDDGGAAVYGCRGVAPASAYVADVVGERGDAVMTAAVVCRAAADTSSDGCNLEEHAAFRLLDAKVKGGGGKAVCYAVADAHLLVVKSEKVLSLA